MPTKKHSQARARAKGAEHWPTRIAELRNAKELSQAKLARLAGVEQPTISRYEAGKRLPDLRQIKKIADALSVHWIELFLPKVLPRNEQEEKLLSAYQALGDKERSFVEHFIRTIPDMPKTAAAD